MKYRSALVPLSESQALTDAIHKLRRVVRHQDMGAAMPELHDIVDLLNTLRLQAERGIHKNPAVEGETAVEHIKNAIMLIMNIPGIDTEEQAEVIRAAITRLEYAISDLERWRGGNPYGPSSRYVHQRLMSPAYCAPHSFRTVSAGRGRKLVVCRTKGSRKTRAQSILRPRGSHFYVHHNPALVVLGGNPPPAPIEATWANLEYHRPDDPEGKKATRVHEFTDGFIAVPQSDGSILLRHPHGKRLWTVR